MDDDEQILGVAILARILPYIAGLVLLIGVLGALAGIFGSMAFAAQFSRTGLGPFGSFLGGVGFVGGLVILLLAAFQALIIWAVAGLLRIAIGVHIHARRSLEVQRDFLSAVRSTSRIHS